MSRTTGALVLAGGKGTRMYSDTPKVLLRVLEEPVLYYVYTALDAVFGQTVWTIIGHGADAVRQAFPDRSEKMILQEQQLGTGHALMVAWPHLVDAGLSHVLVVNGDTPQIAPGTLEQFCASCVGKGGKKPADLAFMSLELGNPGSFGRVIRERGKVKAIVEAKDFQPEIHGQEPTEVNAGIYWISLASIGPLLSMLKANNKNKELYITDLVGFAVEQGLAVRGVVCGNDARLNGVNTPQELVAAEESIRAAIVSGHLAEGVFVRSPETVRIGPKVRIEKGAELVGPCELYGQTSLGAGVRLDSHCKLVDSGIADGAHIKSYSCLDTAQVGAGATVGPYARLRPGAVLEESVHVGNFVEVKKSVLHKGAKVNHLTYIGDADVGEACNVGAGTITCNYDGVNKYRTVIGKGAFIGSNTSLVAPVEIGDNALVGAGSVITKSIPEGQMGVARGRQVVLPRKAIPKK